MRKDGIILVVDDSAADLELIVHCLQAVGMGMPIRALAGGAEALAYLQGAAPYADRDANPYPCMVITDLKMPGVDGLAVLEFLRTHPELAVIPTIVLSGSSDADDVEIAYLLGASSYMVKPASATELCDRMRLVMAYWSQCEAPLVTRAGLHVRTETRGKIGERYSRSPFPAAPPSA